MLKYFSDNKNYQEEKSLKELLKMSMVPLACQECQLNLNGSTIPESIEWLQDLKDKIPIWSRLNEINTSGFKRKLPMSMTKNFDIEIKGRLWSLWGHQRKRKQPKYLSKSYMAATVMALCTARVINLNIWNANLMDNVKNNGREYYKNSLKESCCSHKNFQLKNLNSKCYLEGIGFKINIQPFQKGRLYTQENLACALKNFFAQYGFGILECGNHILGLGFIDGPRGGYFMYDAQSSSYPIFPKDVSAPYVLRTNHLQILLYCLIVALNISNKHAAFCLHQVCVKLAETSLPKIDVDYCINNYLTSESSLSSHFWKTFSIRTSKYNNFDQNICEHEKPPCTSKSIKNLKIDRKYRRKIHNITKLAETSLPKIDVDYCINNYLTSESSLSSHFWKTFSIRTSKYNNFDQNICEHEKPPCTSKSIKNLKIDRKYRRKIHNITKEEVEKSLIKPFVDADRDSDEDVQVKKDFVRIICSQTVVPLIPATDMKNLEKDFVCNLVDALVMGPKLFK